MEHLQTQQQQITYQNLGKQIKRTFLRKIYGQPISI